MLFLKHSLDNLVIGLHTWETICVEKSAILVRKCRAQSTFKQCHLKFLNVCGHS